MPHDQGEVLFPIRLSIKADTLVRKKFERRGDLARLIVEAVRNTDWDSVDVESRNLGRSKIKPQYKTTTIAMPIELHQALADFARNGSHSVSALVDAIVIRYFGAATAARPRAR
jgi:hypothetical protein